MLTGCLETISNSRLLSTEMGTHLTGRYSKTELFPFSFKEFLKAKEIDFKLALTARSKGLLLGHFLEYVRIGGFPDMLSGEGQPYINALFESIVTNDIVFRHNIRYSRTFRELSIYLLNNFSTEISYNRLKTIFGLGSENTVKNYVQYLEEAYLIACLPKFSFKKQESLRYRKVYMIDTAFAAISGNQYSRNDGRLLENVVYLDLARKAEKSRYELFYFKKLVEVDFVIYANREVKELIQVSYSVADQKTFKREVRALLLAAGELNAGKMTIITLDETNEIQEGNMTINIIPITQWLLRD